MFKKPILKTIAISSSLFLTMPVLAFDLYSTTDSNANVKTETTTSEKPDSISKPKEAPNKSELKWHKHSASQQKDKKDMERREQERKERERRAMRRKEQEKQANQQPQPKSPEPATTTHAPHDTTPPQKAVPPVK